MPDTTRLRLSDLRGAARLAFDAATGVTDLVEHMHRTIQQRPGPLGRAVAEPTGGVTGVVYRGVRGGMRLLGRGVDAGLGPLESLWPAGESTPGRDAFLSALNGVYGDHLARTGNPLGLDMSLRLDERVIDPQDPAPAPQHGRRRSPGRRLLVLIHGLCLNERHWLRDGHDHGAALAAELGFTPLYLRYNTGLGIGTNGRHLAELLETVVRHWPQPVDEIVIVGHSMGGLVARSACHCGALSGHDWPGQLEALVFLGTPHQGAPLEKGGHGLDFVMDLSPYSAPFTRIGRMRSAGIKDLRHGSVTDEPHAFVPLPAGVRCYAAAAMLGQHRSALAERLVGDGLVPVDSALGHHADPARALALPKARQWIGRDMGHLDLLGRPEVYARLKSWLSEG